MSIERQAWDRHTCSSLEEKRRPEHLARNRTGFTDRIVGAELSSQSGADGKTEGRVGRGLGPIAQECGSREQSRAQVCGTSSLGLRHSQRPQSDPKASSGPPCPQSQKPRSSLPWARCSFPFLVGSAHHLSPLDLKGQRLLQSHPATPFSKGGSQRVEGPFLITFSHLPLFKP